MLFRTANRECLDQIAIWVCTVCLGLFAKFITFTVVSVFVIHFQALATSQDSISRKKIKKIYMCLPHLDFSDKLLKTHTFFYLA